MRMGFFGDSYDIVKKFLIMSLAPDAEWVVFPMFTDMVDIASIKAFEKFLGVRVIATNIITTAPDRVDCLASSDHLHIFIDPDIGIKTGERINSNKHIFGSELVKLCPKSPERLLLVFDQSFPRIKGKQCETSKKLIEDKLKYFQELNIYAFAYSSHACFIVLSASYSTYKIAYDRLLGSGLPSWRLYPENAKQIAPMNAVEPRR